MQFHDICESWISANPSLYEGGFTEAFARTIIADNALPATRQFIGDQDLAAIYFVLQVLSFQLKPVGDDRWFVHNTSVAHALGRPCYTGLRIFDSEEPTTYHFLDNDNPDLIPIGDDDSNPTKTLVEITGPLKSMLDEYQATVSMVLDTRALFSTKGGYIGLGPKGMRKRMR